MKALTIKQPWAQLIMGGGKDIENRGWPTSLRGRVAVHSSKKLDRGEIESACYAMGLWIPKFSARIFTAEALTYPTGAILGTVEIVDCVRKSDSPWFCGEYGFVLVNPVRCTPIPINGALSFWEVPPDVAAKL